MAAPPDDKSRMLAQHGSLNRTPRRVRDPLFEGDPFFDPRDLVQVKYEMLRSVRVNGQTVAQAARTYGVSRQAFYQTARALDQQGLAGLIRKKPGPHRAHKLTEPVVQFLQGQRAAEPHVRTRTLVDRVRKRFGLSVHPRSIERALARRGKRGR